MTKKLIVPSGIGDILWILKTIPQTGHDFEICKSAKYRGWQLLDLVPKLVDSYKESKIGFDYNDKRITQANRHLEEGNRLEDFTGKLYPLPLQTSQYKKEAEKLFKKKRGRKAIGIYTSSLKHTWVQKGMAWQPSMWVDLIEAMHKKNSKLDFVLLGADYDRDMAEFLAPRLPKSINVYDCVGSQHLGVSIEVMRNLDGFIGFPSGLPIIAHEIKLPTIRLYIISPQEALHLKLIILVSSIPR